MTAVVPMPPPVEWAADPNAPGWNNIVIDVGRFNDTVSPEFRPSTVVVRVGDRIDFQYNSVHDLYTIVQAKSSDEPCTRLDKGLYVDSKEFGDGFGVADDGQETETVISFGYGWYIPYNATQSTVWYYADGYCEQGMRGSFVVNGIAGSSISPEFTDPSSAPSVGLGSASASASGASAPSGSVSINLLSKTQVAGIAVSVVAMVIILAFFSRLLYRRSRAKKTEKMKEKVTDMINGVQVVTHDGVPIKKTKTRDSVASSV